MKTGIRNFIWNSHMGTVAQTYDLGAVLEVDQPELEVMANMRCQH